MCLNNCSDRLWTAESTTLYSTLDLLLNPKFPETDQPNLLFTELGTNIMEALLDVFVWFEGPKIRDRISHGDVIPKSVSKVITQRVLSLAWTLCAKYDTRNCGEGRITFIQL